MLADTLSRALQSPDVEIVICLDPPAAGSGPFDVAVTMGDAPSPVPANVIIRLPEGTRGGSITTARGTEPASVADLPHLVEVLNGVLARDI